MQRVSSKEYEGGKVRERQKEKWCHIERHVKILRTNAEKQ